MKLTTVENKKTAREFLDVARIIYKNDPVWVCPLDNDIEAVFDPEKNVFFSNGEAIRWILRDSQGKLIGRIAAFINEAKQPAENHKEGGIGFFECINDQDAAKMLFHVAEKWLKQKKVTTILGPINFGENDQYWGLLVEGFTHPSYGMAYNPPYYQKFFEDFGFKVKMEQMTNHLDITKPLSPRFVKIAEWALEKRENLRLEVFDMKRFKKYAKDFMEIYNNAWKDHENFTPIKEEYVKETFRKIKPIHDPKLIWFAYINDEPASFILNLPDVNQIFKHFNGKLNFWNKLKFFFLKRKKVINRIRVIAMGTAPKYQGLGLESVLTYKSFDSAMKRGHYVEGELSWVGDFNDKMIAIHKAVGAVPGKKHITYFKEIA